MLKRDIAMSFWTIRKRFLLMAGIVVGTAFVGALFYAPTGNVETSEYPVTRVRTITIKASPGSGSAGSALGERKEGELAKGILDLFYRYRQ
jgi:hypothetical protein